MSWIRGLPPVQPVGAGERRNDTVHRTVAPRLRVCTPTFQRRQSACSPSCGAAAPFWAGVVLTRGLLHVARPFWAQHIVCRSDWLDGALAPVMQPTVVWRTAGGVLHGHARRIHQCHTTAGAFGGMASSRRASGPRLVVIARAREIPTIMLRRSASGGEYLRLSAVSAGKPLATTSPDARQ